MSTLSRTEDHAERAQRSGHLNAIVTLCDERARARARELDAARERGQWTGLLDGLVLMLKDNIDTAGVRTTSGSRFFEEHVPNVSAPVADRLQRAGTVLLGKAAMHEFAFGIRTTSPVSGQCRNPWNPERIPGGSSGGSAAVVAADLCDVAVGSDTGGSVRLPAAMCGVSGLRPTVGRISNRGTTPVCPTQDTLGPMARRVVDVARLFAVMAGYDPADPISVDRPLENFLPTLDAGVEGLRIGIPRNMYFDGALDEVGDAVHAAARELERQGATLVDVTVSGAEITHQFATTIIYSDACAFHEDRLLRIPEGFDPQVLDRMQRGLDFTAVDYSRAMAERARWQRSLGALFDEVDVILSPTVHAGVPYVDDARSLHDATRAATRNTYAGAFGQIPGLSVPCGLDADGMPIGLQIEGPWWSEPVLLRIGHAWQSASDWHERRPG